MSINPTLLQTAIIQTEHELITMSASLKRTQSSSLDPDFVVKTVMYEQKKEQFKLLWDLKIQREGLKSSSLFPPFCPYFPRYCFKIPDHDKIVDSRDRIKRICEHLLTNVEFIRKKKRGYAKSFDQIDDPQLYQLNLDSLLRRYNVLINYRVQFLKLLNTIDQTCLSQQFAQRRPVTVQSIHMVFTAMVQGIFESMDVRRDKLQ